MLTDPGIICFQHCKVRMFCFFLPEVCPKCNLSLHDASFVLEPFTVPYPFIRACQYPCAVVIKPTVGDFLNDYYNSMDLHIGVTTSTGILVEFDRKGLRRHQSNEWDQCLLVDQVNGCWMEQWDSTLLKICKQNCWSSNMYDEHTYNCYTFVLAFLQALGYAELSEAARSSTEFCEKFIVAKTTGAAKYISLFRKVKANGLYMYDEEMSSLG